MDFNIIAQFKVWVSEEEYGKDKFMEIKRVIVEDGFKKLKLLRLVNRIESEDKVIRKGLKNMKFYDFNLAYNHWFEKELLFSSQDCLPYQVKSKVGDHIGEGEVSKLNGWCDSKRPFTMKKDIIVSNNLSLNIKDVIKIYNEFMDLLKNNKDIVYYLDDKYNSNNNNNNNKLKIMFRNIVSGSDNNNNNNNNKYEMVNN